MNSDGPLWFNHCSHGRQATFEISRVSRYLQKLGLGLVLPWQAKVTGQGPAALASALAEQG